MSGPIVALDHVQVAAPAGCEEAARGFYGALLGLEEIAKPPASRRARRGLVPRRHPGAARGGGGTLRGGDEGPSGAPRLDGRASSSGSPIASKRAGSPSGGPTRRRFPGRTRFFVDDPWGNRLEFVA